MTPGFSGRDEAGGFADTEVSSRCSHHAVMPRSWPSRWWLAGLVAARGEPPESGPAEAGRHPRRLRDAAGRAGSRNTPTRRSGCWRTSVRIAPRMAGGRRSGSGSRRGREPVLRQRGAAEDPGDRGPGREPLRPVEPAGGADLRLGGPARGHRPRDQGAVVPAGPRRRVQPARPLGEAGAGRDAARDRGAGPRPAGVRPDGRSRSRGPTSSASWST